MRAIEIESKAFISIYGVYHSGMEIYFYGIYDGDNSLISFRQKDIKVIDPNISFDSVYLDNDGNSYFMLLHWSLVENNLLDRMLEQEIDALLEFSKLKFLEKKCVVN